MIKTKWIIVWGIMMSCTSLWAQTKKCECNTAVMLYSKYTGDLALYNKPGGKFIRNIANDSAAEDFVTIGLHNKNDSMFYVSAYNLFDSLGTGWVHKDTNIVIYTKCGRTPLVLYEKPNLQSEPSITITDDLEPYIVVDCKGEWLKVFNRWKGVIVEGWMAPKDQCSDPYSVCCGE